MKSPAMITPFAHLLLSSLLKNSLTSAFILHNQRNRHYADSGLIPVRELPTSTTPRSVAREFRFARTTTVTRSSLDDEDDANKTKNEFSRVIREDVVLDTKKGRGHSKSVKATTEELEALAKRFDLPAIAELKADLVLTKDRGSDSSDERIRVEGSISAVLTQICVRTNDPFEVKLNVDVETAVKRVEAGVATGRTEELLKSENYKGKDKKKGKRSSRNKNIGLSQGIEIDDMGMMDLEKLLNEFDFEDDVFEDDAIYKDNILDVGELVSQMFYLKLDPYPKKPGTKPVKISITG